VSVEPQLGIPTAFELRVELVRMSMDESEMGFIRCITDRKLSELRALEAEL
jgi:hypothetical protein